MERLSRGGIYLARLDPAKGAEVGKLRPVVVLSAKEVLEVDSPLLFGHSDAGDITPLFSGFYDTRMGAKREASAYTAIAGGISLPPADILFLSDIEGELDAARAAGMQTLWLVRDADPDPAAGHRQVKDFHAIALP